MRARPTPIRAPSVRTARRPITCLPTVRPVMLQPAVRYSTNSAAANADRRNVPGFGPPEHPWTQDEPERAQTEVRDEHDRDRHHDVDHVRGGTGDEPGGSAL